MMVGDIFTEASLRKEELIALLDESSIIVVIEVNDRIICANKIFFEITGLSPEAVVQRSMTSFLTSDSAWKTDEIKDRILKNIKNAQTVRSDDKRLKVKMLDSFGKRTSCKMEIVLLSSTPEIKWGYKLIDEECFKPEQKEMARMEQLKGALLNLSQSLVRLNDVQNFFDLVLEAAGTIINHGDYCAILRLTDEKTLVPVAARGYPWNVIADFVLPVKDSFSWLKLGHILDRTIIIDDIEELYEKSRKFIKIDGYEIRSTIQTPIFLNDELYGILTIDSNQKDVFTETDFNIIEYLRTQIQIALENQLLYNKIQHQASHDQLTDVISRGAFEDQVIKFLRSKHHYESCCIIVMDLNDLKVVNDIWGHAAGDKYLIEFITVMKANMRGSDLLARIGGDEFAICFFSSQSAQFIERLEEIQQHFIDNPLDFGNVKVSCWFSYGISHCPEDGETYDVLMNTADSRMYEMKAEIKSKKMINDLGNYRR